MAALWVTTRSRSIAEMRWVWAWVWILCLSCVGSEASLVRETPEGLQVLGDDIVRVSVRTQAGQPLITRRLPSPFPRVDIPLPAFDSPYEVRVTHENGREERVERPAPGERLPVSLSLQVPVGQASQPLFESEPNVVVVAEGEEAEASLDLTAHQAGTVALTIGQDTFTRTLTVGQRESIGFQLRGDTAITATAGELSSDFRVTVVPRSEASLAEDIRVVERVFPATKSGEPEAARPRDRVQIQSAPVERLLRRYALGYRARDREVPWAHEAVTLENNGETPINVVLTSRILLDGEPDTMFAPRVRQGVDPSGRVRVLLRVPAGEAATAVLPVFLDERVMSTQPDLRPRSRELTVSMVGRQDPLLVDTAQVFVSRGDLRRAGALAGLVFLAGLGWLWAVSQLPKWLKAAPVGDLLLVALFGALAYSASAGAFLLSTTVGMLLGPFAALVTGLFDTVLRYAMWITVLQLRPRVGTASLVLLVSWLVSVVTFGSVGPMELISAGFKMLLLEGLLWTTGVTRLHQGKVLPITLSLAVSSALGVAATYLMLSVFYRMYFAGWFVALMVAIPGFLYVLLAGLASKPFSRAVREIVS